MTRTLFCVLALSMGLSACGGGEEGAATGPSAREPLEATTVTSAPAATSTGPEAAPDLEGLDATARETVEAAVADLAERVGATPEEIGIVSHESVTWNDGSLGCPEPGEMYTQALVDGSRTVLENDGASYHYHAGPDGQPFLCEEPSEGAG